MHGFDQNIHVAGARMLKYSVARTAQDRDPATCSYVLDPFLIQNRASFNEERARRFAE